MTTLSLPNAAATPPHRLPTPPGRWPLVGHLGRIDPLRAHAQFEAWGRELGFPYRLHLGPTRVLVFDDAEAHQHVLRERPGRFSRSGRILPVLREMGIDGLFAAEAETWARQRRLIMQALNASHFRSFFPTLQAITERLGRRWEAAARRAEVLEMGAELMRYTVDVTSALAFGEDPNTIERDGDRIQHHLEAVFPMAMKRIMVPRSWWHWLRLPSDRRLERHLAVVHAHVRDVVARARARMAAQPRAPGEGPRHVLEAMLEQCDAPDSEFTDAMVAANVLTLLLAGEDTTAHSLAWTMPYLAADAALQERLHAQAVSSLGAAPVAPRFETLRELDDFEALATEATRLRPVVSFVMHDALDDAVVGGVAVPRGTRLCFLMRPAATDGANFADPGRYDPARWTDAQARERGAHEPRAHLQFGAGPRVCPGRHLAQVEMRLVLSMLMRRFRVELVGDAAQIREVCAFTMRPDRMPVRLHLRSDCAPAQAVAVPARVSGCPFDHGG